MKDAACTLIVGRRGSGKSHLSLDVVAPFPRVIAFDPLAQYRGKRGWRSFDDRKSMLKAMAQSWGRGFRFAIVPPAGGEAEALHFLSVMLWNVQEPYLRNRSRDKLCLLIEEGDLSLPVTALPVGRRGALQLINQGRHAGIELVVVTQRPALVNASFRANALRSYIFPLADANDLATVSRMLGRQHADRLRRLTPFHFLLWENAQVRPGETLPKGGFRLNSPI